MKDQYTPSLYAGCADTVDIGETSYATALADDPDGDGRTDPITR